MKKLLMLFVAVLVFSASPLLAEEEAGVLSADTGLHYDASSVPVDAYRPNVNAQSTGAQDVLNKLANAVKACQEERDARKSDLIGK